MSNETKQLLNDPNIKPTDTIIADCLGASSSIYTSFVEEMKKQDIFFMEWRYYNDGKTWLSKGEYKWTTVRGTNKVKPIFWVSIWDGFFKISFNFSEKSKEQLLTLPISEETKEMIDNVKPNGNKMKFIPVIFDVDTDKLFNDIILLSQFRKENI